MPQSALKVPRGGQGFKGADREISRPKLTCEVDEVEAAVGGGARQLRHAVHDHGQHRVRAAGALVHLGAGGGPVVIHNTFVITCSPIMHSWAMLSQFGWMAVHNNKAARVKIGNKDLLAAPRAMTASTSSVFDTGT